MTTRYSVNKQRNSSYLDIESAFTNAAFLGGGRFNSSLLTLDGVGADSTTTGTWVSLGVSEDHSGLLTEGSLMMWLNSDYVAGGLDSSGSVIAAVNAASLPASIMNRDGSDANRGTIVVDPNGYIDSQLVIPSTDDEYLHYNLNIAWRGKGSWIPIIHQWSSSGRFQTIVDGLVVADSQIGTYDFHSLDMNPYDVRDPNASTDSDALRNVALLDSFQDIGSPKIRIGFIGDSLMNFGGFPDWMWSSRTTQRPDWIPIENSFATAGPKGIDGSNGAAAESVNGKHYDAGALTTIIRMAHKSGYLSSKNLNFTQGGATTAQIKTNLNNLLSIGVPNVVFCNAGQNDANDGASFDASAKTTFESNLKSMVSTAYNSKVNQFITSTLHSMQNNTTYSDQVYADNVDYCNAVINSLPRWSKRQGYGDKFLRVADNFTAFGGHSFDSNLFLTNDVHHSTAGSYLFGYEMGKMISDIVLGKRFMVGARSS